MAGLIDTYEGHACIVLGLLALAALAERLGILPECFRAPLVAPGDGDREEDGDGDGAGAPGGGVV